MGETLIEETRFWGAWADEMGIPRMTFFAAFGAIVERGEQYPAIFDYFPFDTSRARREAVWGRTGPFRTGDLYPDVISSLDGLRRRGYRVAILGNQPARRTAELRALGVESEVMMMSEEMGVAKPDAAFFSRTLELIGSPPPESVAYVGDRIDNDVIPASDAGMRAVWIRRGPWGRIPRSTPAHARLVVDSLSELVERVDEAWDRSPGRGHI